MKERAAVGGGGRCAQLKGAVIKVVIDIKVATLSPRQAGAAGGGGLRQSDL